VFNISLVIVRSCKSHESRSLVVIGLVNSLPSVRVQAADFPACAIHVDEAASIVPGVDRDVAGETDDGAWSHPAVVAICADVVTQIVGTSLNLCAVREVVL
jgi:hypothetical protein